MNDQNDASPVGLTEMQQTLLSRKLDMLRKDFHIVALYVRVADGQEWKVGDVQLAPPSTEKKPKPGAKSKRVQKQYYDTPRGTCIKALVPWLEVAASEPGTKIVLRPDDIPELEWHRVPRALSSSGFNKYGPGRVHVISRQDEFGPFAHLWVDPLPESADSPAAPAKDFIAQELLQTAKAVLSHQPTKSYEAQIQESKKTLEAMGLSEARTPNSMADRVQSLQDNFNRDRKR